jgi:Ser/Thr protein kinase RdoA (MazF antagonist)
MHDQNFAADVPMQRIKFEKRIQHADGLSDSLRTDLQNRLASLPNGERICHGDFHPGNVLVSPKGEAVIDWIDASRGNPLADVARTSIILLGVAESGQESNPLLKLFVKTFHSAYLKYYFQIRPGGEQEYRQWLPIVAAARLSEGIHELKGWLLKQAEKN